MAACVDAKFPATKRRMMVRVGCLALLMICIASAMSVPASAYAGTVLITDEEAKLPPPRGAVAADRRGITRGPKIEVIGEGEPNHSPLHLQLRFESFGGAKIDISSVKVTYLRTPAVDLTDRIRSFVQATGIDMPDAQLPPGDHMIRVDIKDSDGRMGSTSFVLKVSP
jgi:hypothetical protein